MTKRFDSIWDVRSSSCQPLTAALNEGGFLEPSCRLSRECGRKGAGGEERGDRALLPGRLVVVGPVGMYGYMSSVYIPRAVWAESLWRRRGGRLSVCIRMAPCRAHGLLRELGTDGCNFVCV